MAIEDARAEQEVILASQQVSLNYCLTDKLIYRGLASTIFLAVENGEALQVGIKVLMKQNFDSEQERKSALAEVAIHSALPPHPNVIRLLAAEETADALLLVTPYTPHGDLWDLVRYGDTYCEKEVRNCTAQMLFAVRHLHALCGLIHADIKPHNFLLFRHFKQHCVQLCDFGLAERPEDASGMVRFNMVRGTSGWFSPEMLWHRDYSFPIDLFGVGLIMFRMLGGYMPFDPPSRFEEVVDYDERCWCHVSGLCKSLISRLLSLDPAVRGSASEVCEHEWIRGPEPPPPRPEQLEALTQFGPPPKFDIRFWPAGQVPEPHRCNSFANLPVRMDSESFDGDSTFGDSPMSP